MSERTKTTTRFCGCAIHGKDHLPECPVGTIYELAADREALAARLAAVEAERDVLLVSESRELADARAERDEAQRALDWYRDHRNADGSYDGSLYGDLLVRFALPVPARTDETTR